MDISTVKSFFASLTLEKLIPALITLVIGFFLVKILTKLFNKLLSRSKLDKTAHGFLRSAFRVVLYALVGLVAGSSLGFDVTSLVALLSIISLAFSLAVQGTLSNLAGGLMLLSTHPFRIGDYVEVGGVSGTVLEIGMSYTKLSTPDQKEIFVPNSEISSSKIINYNACENRRVDLTFTASYDDSIESVKVALLKAADHASILNDPSPFVAVNNYGDHAIEYVMRLWVPSADYWDVHFTTIENVKKCFDEAGITMTYPHLNIHLNSKEKKEI